MYIICECMCLISSYSKRTCTDKWEVETVISNVRAVALGLELPKERNPPANAQVL